jgi:hypothetical protein
MSAAAATSSSSVSSSASVSSPSSADRSSVARSGFGVSAVVALASLTEPMTVAGGGCSHVVLDAEVFHGFHGGADLLQMRGDRDLRLLLRQNAPELIQVLEQPPPFRQVSLFVRLLDILLLRRGLDRLDVQELTEAVLGGPDAIEEDGDRGVRQRLVLGISLLVVLDLMQHQHRAAGAIGVADQRHDPVLEGHHLGQGDHHRQQEEEQQGYDRPADGVAGAVGDEAPVPGQERSGVMEGARERHRTLPVERTAGAVRCCIEA